MRRLSLPTAAMGNYLTPRSAGPVSAYELSTEPIPGALRGFRVQLYRRGCSPPLSWQDVLHLWSEDSEFNASFSAALAAVSFRDFFWETAPVSGQSMASQPFECVVLDAQGSLINRQASHQDFDEHFARHARQQSSSTAVSFLNLGRDATLVAPMPQGGTSTKAYGSLATFVRDAHPQEQDEFWSTVGKVLLRELERSPRRPLWLIQMAAACPGCT